MSRTTTPKSAIKNVSPNQELPEKKVIEETSQEPGLHVIQNILRYSKALEVKKSENIGIVENLMN